MTIRERWLLAIAGVALLGWALHYVYSAVPADALVQNVTSARASAGGDSFTATEVQTFLTAAQKAEAIADPLQRCLDYPDPPGSHWSHAAVAAYCRNQLVTGIRFDDLKAQIEAGHADAVDRQMAALLHEQIASDMHGVLDATYEIDFDNASADVRRVLDDWKRQSPQSAFAYAASGVAYVCAAGVARGSAWAADTPQANFAAMNALLLKARADLDHAVALDKRVIPAYTAMIRVAQFNGDDAYARSAAARALQTDPSDYLVYSRLTTMAQPKWDGSIHAMRAVITQAERHAGENPLLVLLAQQADAVAAGLDDCGCDEKAAPAVYRRLFDQIIAKGWLGGAGTTAWEAWQENTAAIYLSEALRFVPDDTDYLVARSNTLTTLGRYTWALADANHAIRIAPATKTAWTARGYAHVSERADADAEADFRHALTLAPADPYSLRELGVIDMHQRRWDDGWNVANQLIVKHPDNADGWILRASIQKDEPRAGLDDTIHYFLAHFGDDPAQQRIVTEMRQTLAQEAHRRKMQVAN